MLLVLDRDARNGVIDTVTQRVTAAGLRSHVINGQPTVVQIDGPVTRDFYEELLQLDGVAGTAGFEAAEAPVTSNLRISAIRPLVSPAILMEHLPLSPQGARLVQRSRDEISAVLNQHDDRLLVVVGPCSIHDTAAALDYAARLAHLAPNLVDDLVIVMRVYFEKPRTTVGWKGLINDPHRDESYAVNDGLHMARKLLLDVIETGLPAGCEFLDPITPQFIADAVSWAAIGARTTESQVHRNLTSGLSMPVGFKNGTGGGIQMAIDAISAASYPHHFMSVTQQGLAAIVVTRGNADTHVILRGGSSGPNFDAASVNKTVSMLAKAGLPGRVMIDASHGNSGKDWRNQPVVAADIAARISAGDRSIVGVMLESFIEDGRQELASDAPLVFGQSITDSCLGWGKTMPVLHELAAAVAARRRRN